jgi:hypothetical protein
MKNITTNITGQYMMLFATALLIGVPLSYFLIKVLIEAAYVYHMPVTFSGAAIAASTLVLVFLITVATQIKTVIKSNPVDGLKME